MQQRRALLVAAAHRVHKRRTERCQHTGQQRRIADAARLAARLPETRHAGLHRAGIDGGTPRVELAHGRRPVTARRRRLRLALLGGPVHPRIRGAPQLAAEQDVAGVRMLARGPDLIRPRQAPHEQFVRAVVEAVQRDRA